MLVLIALPCLYLGARRVWQYAQEDDIYAAVFRYRFERGFSKAQQSQTFYLEVAGKDPDARLMRQLRGNRPAVKKSSAWRHDSRAGCAMRILYLGWISNHEAAVASKDSTTALMYDYWLTRSNGKWRVTHVQRGMP